MSKVIPTTEPERTWWLAGATAESQWRAESIRPACKQVVACAEILADTDRASGADEDDGTIAAFLSIVFTTEWRLSRRLRLAWRIVKPVDNPLSWRKAVAFVRAEPRPLVFAYGAVAGYGLSTLLWLATR